MPKQTPQARYWLLTIPFDAWQPPTELPPNVKLIKGQHERGASGYEHWQVLVIFGRPTRLAGVKSLFGGDRCHAEPSRSAAADQYVWKEDTCVPGSKFSLGEKPFQRNSATDWSLVRKAAVNGDLSSVPDDIFVRYHTQLQSIKRMYIRAQPMARTVRVYWGVTGSGKSHRAFEEAGADAYWKNPSSIWWDGYQGEENVIIDEFRGGIGIQHILRWFDKYPVTIEYKGGACALMAKNIWITSNLSPEQWYPDLDAESLSALRRKINVTHFSLPFAQ